MSIIGVSTSRVTQLMQSNSILNQIDTTESQLNTTQNQLATGLRISEPGDDPGAAAIVMQLNRTLDQQTTYQSNLASSQSQLSQVDSSLGSLNTLLIQANSIASQNVGSEVSASQRQSAATIIESIYSQTLSLSNTQYNGQYVFGGDKSDNPPFVAANGGVQFVGSDQILANAADVNTTLPFQVTASSVFGALSSRVSGSVDLTPDATPATRIIDLHGATNQGVQLGTIQISNGTTTAQVDLSHADNVQDVVDSINNAAIGGITASISGNHLVLSAGASDNITVTDIGGGSTAATLGIAQSTGAGPGVNLTGASLQPAVTVLTPISAAEKWRGNRHDPRLHDHQRRNLGNDQPGRRDDHGRPDQQDQQFGDERTGADQRIGHGHRRSESGPGHADEHRRERRHHCQRPGDSQLHPCDPASVS